MSALCFVDTETTSLRPDREAWEIAVIRRDENGERTREMFVEVALRDADPAALAVGGFYERHPDGLYLSGRRPSAPVLGRDVTMPEDAAAAVARWTHDAHLIGVNPAFDAGVLEALLRRCSLAPAWHYHLVDVSCLAIGWLNARSRDPRVPITPPWKSYELSLMCGVEPPTEEDRHTALGDARWAMRLYDALTVRGAA